MIRRLALVVVSTALAYSGVSLVNGLAPHSAHADPGWSQFCTKVDNIGFSHGGCVSLFESSPRSSDRFAHFCSLLMYPAQYGDVTFENRGECVTYLKSQFGSSN